MEKKIYHNLLPGTTLKPDYLQYVQIGKQVGQIIPRSEFMSAEALLQELGFSTDNPLGFFGYIVTNYRENIGGGWSAIYKEEADEEPCAYTYDTVLFLGGEYQPFIIKTS